MKITNRLYNDSPYLAICFNEECSLIVCSDHAGYLITMLLNEVFGDTEEEGITYKKKSMARIKKTQDKQKTGKISHNKPNYQGTDLPLAKQRRTPFTSVV